MIPPLVVVLLVLLGVAVVVDPLVLRRRVGVILASEIECWSSDD